MTLRCLCGAPAYTFDDLARMAREQGDEFPGEAEAHASYWRSVLGPLDLYCAGEDEVLGEAEAWRARGLTTPVHDQEPDDPWPDLFLVP